MSDTIQVSAGIIVQEDRVLVCQRKRTVKYPLQWEFPGGKVERGETIDECLQRELKEELSIDAEIGPLFHHQLWVYPDSGSYEVFFFMVPSFTGTVTNITFEQIAWIEISGLNTITMLDGNREVVEKLLLKSKLKGQNLKEKKA
jgi:8-oxo-dGTP diphosphatase